MPRITVDATTDTESLVGGTFTDRYGDTFTITSADHAPELNAVAYGGRGAALGIAGGYSFAAMLPYGAVLESH